MNTMIFADIEDSQLKNVSGGKVNWGLVAGGCLVEGGVGLFEGGPWGGAIMCAVGAGTVIIEGL